VLNPKVGLIYGDGMVYETFEKILHAMRAKGFASSNLVIGVGGILLQSHTRDEFGFSLKATSVVRNGERFEIFKDPVTDPGKKSKRGLMALYRDAKGFYYTKDQCTPLEEQEGCLWTVFEDGKILKETNIDEIRRWMNKQFEDGQKQLKALYRSMV
jgi:nicotinamide phosphoribosyltransferase